jgi:hypothetical protein
MPPKKEKKRKITIKAKASAKSIVNINIGKGKSTPKRTAKVVKGISHSSPTIYSPAPTPFYVSAPQASPYSMFQETSADFRRNMATSTANSIQQREILPLPISSIPSGSFVDTPATREFTNTDVPDSITRLTFVEEPAAVERRGRPKGTDPKIQQSKDEARRVLDRMGIPYRTSDSLGSLQAKYREAVSGLTLMKKDPFV